MFFLSAVWSVIDESNSFISVAILFQNHASSSEWEGEDSGQDGDRNDAQDLQVHVSSK